MKKTDKSYYQILGLKPDAAEGDIKRAYRKIVKEQHPDVGQHSKSAEEIRRDTEDMLLINEAYETLMDKQRRAEYDVIIGITISIQQFHFSTDNEDERRQVFLSRVFNPSRNAVNKVISNYKKQIKQLSQDPFDEELVQNFEAYLNEIESALRKAANSFSTHPAPGTLEPAVHMMRHCIAQASDALDEMRRFCLNYDYDHLATAESLFRIAWDLSRQAFVLTKNV